jgi:hypothetical protein
MASREPSEAVESFETSFVNALTWSGAVLAPPSTAGWMSRTMTTRMRRVGRWIVLTTGAVFAASGFNEATELSHLLSQSVGLDPGDEHQLVILSSVGDGMCCGYGDGDGSAAL